MYIVAIYNSGVKTEIHNSKRKLSSGKITKGINAIDSFQFSMSPANIGFNEIYDYTTLVSVYNTNRDRYEFYGRVLYSEDTMSENGEIKKEVICESYFGFLCDSQQEYVAEKNWSVGGLLEHIINKHNSQVESYKQFTIGEVTVTDPNDIVYCGIQRKNTWEALKEKLLDVLGGEFRFRVEGDAIYLDYLTEIGELSETPIAMSRNMKSLTREKDPSEIVTRLIPLGCKLKGEDEEGKEVETEYRLEITSVNDGKNYIDDDRAIALYGIRVGTVEFDDVTVASTLLVKGEKWLEENNKIKVTYTATALDLSLIGLEVDDFEVCNYHPLINPLLGINDTVRIIKKNIDICEEIKSTIEFGDNFEKLTDVMKKQSAALNLITSNYVTNVQFYNMVEKTSTLIEQSEEQIRLEAKGYYDGLKKDVTAELALKVGRNEKNQIISMINASANAINLTADRLNISSATQWFGKRAFELSGGKIYMGVTHDDEGADYLKLEDCSLLIHEEGADGEFIESTGYYADGITRRVNRTYSPDGCITLMTAFFDDDLPDDWVEIKLNPETMTIFAQKWGTSTSTSGQHYVYTNLTNCNSSNTTKYVDVGSSYSTTITPWKAGSSNLESITVKMGGVDITSSVVNGNTVTIPNVTGDVTITAVGKASDAGGTGGKF